MFVLMFDDRPKKCYMMIKDVIMEADVSMHMLMERTKVFTSRQALNIQVRIDQVFYSCDHVAVQFLVKDNQKFHHSYN